MDNQQHFRSSHGYTCFLAEHILIVDTPCVRMVPEDQHVRRQKLLCQMHGCSRCRSCRFLWSGSNTFKWLLCALDKWYSVSSGIQTIALLNQSRPVRCSWNRRCQVQRCDWSSMRFGWKMFDSMWLDCCNDDRHGLVLLQAWFCRLYSPE
jgi:hypothetical protein